MYVLSLRMGTPLEKWIPFPLQSDHLCCAQISTLQVVLFHALLALLADEGPVRQPVAEA